MKSEIKIKQKLQKLLRDTKLLEAKVLNKNLSPEALDLYDYMHDSNLDQIGLLCWVLDIEYTNDELEDWIYNGGM